MMDLGGKAALVVGISGASSSGKTTLSRLLCDIFPNTFILHEDDFYKAEIDIPIKDGLLDWDCAEALNLPNIVKSLDYIQRNGTFPPDFESIEDRNDIGECPIPDSDSVIATLKTEVDEWTQPGHPGHVILNSLRLYIFDGFLLYSPSMASIQRFMDIKLFLRVSYAKAKARREARSSYATIEGFWEDPPAYVDKVVWPNYVSEHQWMFEQGDVEGKPKIDVLNERGIKVQLDKGPDVDMGTTLRWAVETLMEELEKLVTN